MREDWPRVTRRTTLSHACFKYFHGRAEDARPFLGPSAEYRKGRRRQSNAANAIDGFSSFPSSVCERRYALHQHDRIFVVAGGGRLVGTLDADKVGKFLQRRRAARGDQAHRGLAAEENTGVV